MIPTIIFTRPKINGLGLIIAGASCYVGSTVCFLIGASRSYDFNVLKSSNVLQYKNKTITTETYLNNISDIIQQQERDRQLWNYGGLGLAVVGTGLNLWGIITVFPNGVAIKF